MLTCRKGTIIVCDREGKRLCEVGESGGGTEHGSDGAADEVGTRVSDLGKAGAASGRAGSRARESSRGDGGVDTSGGADGGGSRGGAGDHAGLGALNGAAEGSRGGRSSRCGSGRSRGHGGRDGRGDGLVILLGATSKRELGRVVDGSSLLDLESVVGLVDERLGRGPLELSTGSGSWV
jgi:hypothetical protein